MNLDAAFEQDLGAWLAHVYEQAELRVRREGHLSVERVVERQNRILIGLVVVLTASIFLLPFAGGIAVVGALILLYVGAIVSSTFTALKIRALERSTARQDVLRWRRQLALQEAPAIRSDERAVLVRIMNLSRLRPTGASRNALAAELAEARRSPSLAAWPALEDAAVLLEDVPPLDDE